MEVQSPARREAIELLIAKIDALIERVTPKDVESARFLEGTQIQVTFHQTSRSIQFNFPRRECVALVSMSDGWPPIVSARGMCWDYHQHRSCRHVAGALIALRRHLSTSPENNAIRQWLRLAIPPSPEDILDRLDQVLEDYTPSSDRSEGWLAWRIAASSDRFIVHPVKRTLKKDDTPTKGTVLSMQSSASDLMRLARTDQDVAVASYVRAKSPTSSWGYYTPSLDQHSPYELLALLAGHPEVEWADGSHIRIARREPGLAVYDHDNHYDLKLSMNGEPVVSPSVTASDDTGVAAYWQGNNLIVVGLWSPRVARLTKELLKSNIRVPHALGAALVQRLSKVRRTIPIALPEELKGRTVPPDNTPIVVVEPQQPEGAMFRIVVRPLPGGPLQVPGVGERELSAFNANEQLSTTRDLEAEVREASRLAAQLPMPPAYDDPWIRHLTDEEVLDFVSQLQAPEFEGLRVEWPEGAKPKVLSQPVRSMRIHIEAREDWFGVEGTTEIDGVKIELATLISSLRTGKRFISLGQGRFVEIERAFRERISRLGDVAHEGRQGLQLSPVAAPLAKDVLDGLEVVAPLPWKQLIERVEKASKVTPKPPKRLAATLRDYQLEGYRWLWRLSQMGAGGVLADDMGLGKTVQAIAMLVERAELGPQLVLAPTSVGMNWHREIERFAPTLKPIDFRTADREQIVEHARSGDVIIASYGLLRQDLEALQSRTWATLIFDEAHAFKNYATQTAKAVRSLKADWKLALTGTPMENHLGELYSLMHTVCPGLFGTWEHFAFGFAKPIEKDKDTERRNALARLLQPFILRRTKAQVLTELPPRTEIRLDVVLSKQERAMYEAMRLAALSSMEEADETIDQRFIVLAALTRLRQISSHARMIEPTAPKISAKQTVLMEQLEEVLEEGHTALVFSQFTSQLKLLEEEMHARKMKTLYLDGTTPAGERRKRVDAFQRGDAPIFLVSLKAGGTGLNLTAADYVFLMDPWWNPAVEDQAADRAHRIGQTRPVTIVRLVASGTVEEKVLSLHAKKRQLVASVLDGADAAGKLNTEELIDLLREGQKPSSKPSFRVIEQEKRRRSRNLGPRAKGK